jgi:hypothetical protein
MDSYVQIYSALLAAVLLLSWRSDVAICQKVALLMLLDWAGYSIVHEAIASASMPLFMPMWSAFIVILLMIFGWANKSKLCLAVIGIYWIEEAIHVTMFANHLEGSHLHYALVNATFIARMFVLGGVALANVAHRIRSKHCRFPHRLVGV